jgi:hypothetical protein
MTSKSIPKLSSNSQAKDNDLILKKYEGFRISATRPLLAPIPVISINGTSISTEGSLTVLSGDSKSGKSALCNVILAGAICSIGELYDGFNGIDIESNYLSKAVIHFDTEQSQHQHYKSFKNNILKRVNLNQEPSFYYSYNIRRIDISKYKELCKEIFQACSEKNNGIHLAVIDGVADFIKSVNDEEESNAIIKYFEQLAVEFKTPIILVVHFNPKSDKQRGHLGSQLQRKAESVLAIKKNEGISYIVPQLLRNGSNSSIPHIQFSYDETKGYHTSCGFFTKISKEDEDNTSLFNLTKNVFSDDPITYTEAVEKLIKITKSSKRTMSSRLKKMVDLNYVFKSKDKLYTINNN